MTKCNNLLITTIILLYFKGYCQQGRRGFRKVMSDRQRGKRITKLPVHQISCFATKHYVYAETGEMDKNG
jgi:hypothetical protein